MARGGAREGAGRKPGSVTKRTREIAEAALEGLSPLDFMLGVMRDEKRAFEDRFDAAKGAAPFIHARLAAVTVDGNIDSTVTHTVDEKAAKRAMERVERALDALAGISRNAGKSTLSK